jgi:hypothetical protein
MNWFRKWSFNDEVPMDDVYKRLYDLEKKYEGLLHDVVRLEEENVSLTNELYRMENSLDSRIDILYNDLKRG